MPPRRHPPRLRPTELDGEPFMNRPLRLTDSRHSDMISDVISDDEVTLSLQYSTPWDRFAHVGCWFDADADGEPEKVSYNGFRAHEDVLGIEHFAAAPIQGRGVLVDLHAHFGDERVAVDHERLLAVLAADGVAVAAGDLLMFHAGFATRLWAMDREPDLARPRRRAARARPLALPAHRAAAAPARRGGLAGDAGGHPVTARREPRTGNAKE